MATELHQYDTGASLIIAIQETNLSGTTASLDVSGASGIWFYYTKPDESTTGSWSGSPRSGSANQLIYVTTASTDLSTAGIWKLQAYFHLNPWDGSTEAVPFEVFSSMRS